MNVWRYYLHCRNVVVYVLWLVEMSQCVIVNVRGTDGISDRFD